MQLTIKPGKYIIAVSGGVDSIVLLHLLYQIKVNNKNELLLATDFNFIVAHYDHGIRAESKKDRLFVEELANKYKMPFYYQEGHLGAQTSEDMARRRRYQFLNELRSSLGATAIVTAHHQDDVIETAIINILRGTGRRGLTSLSSREDLLRPLLLFSKKNILEYAKRNNLVWCEDSTNQQINFLRNYVRHNLVSRFKESDRQRLISIIETQRRINHELDNLISNQFHSQKYAHTIDRQLFNQLPFKVAKEFLAFFLRENNVRNFNKKTIELVTLKVKTGKIGQTLPLSNNDYLVINKDFLALTRYER